MRYSYYIYFLFHVLVKQMYLENTCRIPLFWFHVKCDHSCIIILGRNFNLNDPD